MSLTSTSRSSPKNMCSVRHSPIPSAPNDRARAASSGVSAFALTPSRRNSSAQASTWRKSSPISGVIKRDVIDRHRAARAVDRDRVALGELRGPYPSDPSLDVDLKCRGAGHARPAHAPSDEGRVRGLSARGGEYAAGCVKAGHVVGAGEWPHEDHGLAFACAAHRLLGAEHDRPLCRAGRGRDAAGEHFVARVGVEHRMEQGLERPRVDRR